MPEKVTPNGTMEEAAKTTKQEEGVLDSYSRRTTIHGLRYVLSPEIDSRRRIIWGIVLLILLFFFFYWTYQIMAVYFQYSVNTQINVVEAAAVPYPAVTICSQNPLKLTSLSDAGTYNSIKTIYPNSGGWADAITSAGLNTSEVAVTAAPTLADLLISCQYGNVNCSAGTSMWSPILTSIGQCHTFTTPSGQVAPGDHGGLRLMLNTEAYETTSELGGSPGIKFLVHSEKDVPKNGENAISVSPGYQVLGQLSLTQWSRLPAPYSSCGDTDGKSQRACQTACILQDVKTACGCAPYYDAGPGDTMCNTTAQKQCGGALFYRFITTGVTSSTCSCPVPCSEDEFNTATTFSQLSEASLSRDLSAAAKSAMTTGFSQAQAAVNSSGAPALPSSLAYSDNVIQLQLFFKRIRFTKVTDTVATTSEKQVYEHAVSLLICFGMSIVSWFEIVDLVIVAIVGCCCGKGKRGKHTYA